MLRLVGLEISIGLEGRFFHWSQPVWDRYHPEWSLVTGHGPKQKILIAVQSVFHGKMRPRREGREGTRMGREGHKDGEI